MKNSQFCLYNTHNRIFLTLIRFQIASDLNYTILSNSYIYRYQIPNSKTDAPNNRADSISQPESLSRNVLLRMGRYRHAFHPLRGAHTVITIASTAMGVPPICQHFDAIEKAEMATTRKKAINFTQLYRTHFFYSFINCVEPSWEGGAVWVKKATKEGGKACMHARRLALQSHFRRTCWGRVREESTTEAVKQALDRRATPVNLVPSRRSLFGYPFIRYQRLATPTFSHVLFFGFRRRDNRQGALTSHPTNPCHLGAKLNPTPYPLSPISYLLSPIQSHHNVTPLSGLSCTTTSTVWHYFRRTRHGRGKPTRGPDRGGTRRWDGSAVQHAVSRARRPNRLPHPRAVSCGRAHVADQVKGARAGAHGGGVDATPLSPRALDDTPSVRRNDR